MVETIVLTAVMTAVTDDDEEDEVFYYYNNRYTYASLGEKRVSPAYHEVIFEPTSMNIHENELIKLDSNTKKIIDFMLNTVSSRLV